MSETTTNNTGTNTISTTALPTDALLATAAIVDAAKAIAAQFTPWDKDPKTKGAALHFASLANDKAGKLLHEAVQSLAKGLYLNSLAESLPEAAAPTAKAHPVYEVGTVVSFRFGRGQTARVLAGEIVGRKVEDDKVQAYRIVVGEGFDAESFVVMPGSIKGFADDSNDDADNSTDNSTEFDEIEAYQGE